MSCNQNQKQYNEISHQSHTKIAKQSLYFRFSWVSAATGVIAMVIMMPGIFFEFNVAAKEHRLIEEKKKGNISNSICKRNGDNRILI